MKKIAFLLCVTLCITHVGYAKDQHAKKVETNSAALKGKRPRFIGEGSTFPDLKRKDSVRQAITLLAAAAKKTKSNA